MKMTKSVKRMGEVKSSRVDAKNDFLKSNPKLSSKEGLRSETNTFKTKPAEAPSYIPSTTTYNGQSYQRELYQSPSGDYSYRYRSTTGDIIEAMAIASIANSAMDYAMYRNGYHYHGSPYSGYYNNYNPPVNTTTVVDENGNIIDQTTTVGHRTVHRRGTSFWGFMLGTVFVIAIAGVLIYVIKKSS